MNQIYLENLIDDLEKALYYLNKIENGLEEDEDLIMNEDEEDLLDVVSKLTTIYNNMLYKLDELDTD